MQPTSLTPDDAAAISLERVMLCAVATLVEQRDAVRQGDHQPAILGKRDAADEVRHRPALDGHAGPVQTMDGGGPDIDPVEGLRRVIPDRAFAQDVAVRADPGDLVHQTVRPPSTGNSTPVMKAPSSEAR